MTVLDNKTVARYALVVIGLLLATALLLALVYEARQTITWIVIATFFAVALHPAVSWVQRRARWLRRWLATLIVFILAFTLIAGLVAALVLPLAREAAHLADNLPKTIADVRAGRGPIGHLATRLHVLNYVQTHSEQLRGYLSRLGAPTLALLRGAVTGVAGVLTIFVLSYLMVLQGPKVTNSILALFDERHGQRIRRVGSDCAKTVTGYITGNLLISVICGLLTYLVLAALGIPYAGLIALFVGLTDLIPLIGATLGAVAGVIAGFTQSVIAGIVITVFFIIYQQVENHLLQPVVFSRTVQLNPLTVLIAILIAADLAGILGALLAIPVAGIIQIMARDIRDTHKRRPNNKPTARAQHRPTTTAAGDDKPEPPHPPPPGAEPPEPPTPPRS